MAAPSQNEAFQIRATPDGVPKEDTWEKKSEAIPEIKDGQVLLKAMYISVDPYLRWRLKEAKMGENPVSNSVSQVSQSKNEKFPVGSYVQAYLPWKRFNVSDGRGLRIVDPKLAPVSTAVGILGMPGMTAYVGCFDIGSIKAGDTFLVSAAAGAVGSAAGQIAKLKGCRVVGVARGDKAKLMVDQYGFDAAIDYSKFDTLEKIRDEYKRLCPKGIDVYFDNVGGYTTDAVFDVLNEDARVVVCGQISLYNIDMNQEVGPRFLHKLIYKNVTVKGFVVSKFQNRAEDFYRDMGQWVKEGKVKYEETVLDGFDKLPQAMIGLFTGANTGKMVVKVA